MASVCVVGVVQYSSGVTTTTWGYTFFFWNFFGVTEGTEQVGLPLEKCPKHSTIMYSIIQSDS